MFRRILSHLRPVTLFVVVLASALGWSSVAVAAQASGPEAPFNLPASTTTPPAMIAAWDTSSPYYSVQTITLGDGARVDQVIINGPSKPPPGFELERAAVAAPALSRPGVASSLPVPAYNWVFGCSAVSAAMIGAYFDRNGLPNIYTGATNGGVMPMDNSVWPTWTDGFETYPNNPLIASHNGSDGRTIRGSIDDYWVKYDSTAPDPYLTGGWAQHAWGDAFGDYMKTSQSAHSNPDGSTYFTWYTNGTPLTCTAMETLNPSPAARDGAYGRKLFYQARGYTVTDCYNQRTDNAIAGGFSFANYKAQIDAGYPVLLNLAGHSIVGIGYLDPSTVYINDTWDNVTHQMTWGGSYSGMVLQSVSVVNPVISNPVPAITTLAPSSAAPGGPTFTLTVNGTGFINSSVVRWNGVDRTTTYVSGTRLTAVITAADIAAPTTASVTVVTPKPGGGTSNAVSFVVSGNPVPTITGLKPFYAAPGGLGFTLTVNGTGFLPGSVVRWKGLDRATTYSSGTQLTAAITQADIASPGTASITVVNPPPGGSESNSASFLVGFPKTIHLPVVVKNYPPVAATPVLNPISNADGDGSYSVSWGAATNATGYLLQEDDHDAFTSPTTVYSGAGTSWNASGKTIGTYFYRVQASNTWGTSGWSNVVSVVVQPTGPMPGFWKQPNGGMELYVTSDRRYVDDFAIYVDVSGCGRYKITHLIPEPISGNSFSFSGPFYASGTFSTQTAASGTTGLSNFHISGCGDVSGGPWAWAANRVSSVQLTPSGAAATNEVRTADPGSGFEVTRIR